MSTRLSVRDLKLRLEELGVDASGCVERADLEQLLQRHDQGYASCIVPWRPLAPIANPGHGLLLKAIIGTLDQLGTTVSLRSDHKISEALAIEDRKSVLAVEDAAVLALEDAVSSIGQLATCDKTSAQQRALDYQSSASSGATCRILALPTRQHIGTDANTTLLAYRTHVAAIADGASEEEFREAYFGESRRLFDQLDLHMEMFDKEFDYDFSCSPYIDAGYRDEKHWRGGIPYVRPLGWKRFALRVQDKFETSVEWLDAQGKEGEWAVAYHGTSSFSVRPIATDGLRTDVTRAHGALYGEGIYCAPDPEVAAFFAKPVAVDEAGQKHNFQVVFQCRVRPGSFEKHQDCLGEFWVVKSEGDVRPYGMLLGECDEDGEGLSDVRQYGEGWSRKVESGGSHTWKSAAGRTAGREGYKFGDVTRCAIQRVKKR